MCRNYRQVDETGLAFGAVHALRGFYVIIGAREKDIGHKRLWIAVVEREPGGLNLHHDAVTGQKNVVRGG